MHSKKSLAQGDETQWEEGLQGYNGAKRKDSNEVPCLERRVPARTPDAMPDMSDHHNLRSDLTHAETSARHVPYYNLVE